MSIDRGERDTAGEEKTGDDTAEAGGRIQRRQDTQGRPQGKGYG